MTAIENTSKPTNKSTVIPALPSDEKGPKAKPTNVSGVIEPKTDAGTIQIVMFKTARTAGK